MQPSPVLTRLLLAGIFLIALSPLVSHGQPADQLRNTLWLFSVKAGEVSHRTAPLNHMCNTPQLYRVKSHEKFFRFDPPTNSVTLTQAPTPFPVVIDATKLRPDVYRVKVTINCLDCTPALCPSQPLTAIARVTVLQPSPSGKKEESSEGKAEAKQISLTLKNELRRVSIAFKARVQGLAVFEGVTPDKKRVKGYDAGEVSAVIEETKRQILNALAREELHPLRDYVSQRFPPPDGLKTLRVEIVRAPAATSAPDNSAQLPPLGFYAVRATFETRVIATVESARKAFESVAAFIELLESNVEPVTLTFNSVPEGANVEVLSVLRKKKYSTNTNAPIAGIWPGTYIIEVTMDGFRTIAQKVDLGIPYTIKVVECLLVTSGTPRYCRLR